MSASIEVVDPDVILNAKRIVIYGCTGSGKTTAAAEVGHLLRLPVIDGDAMCWRPGWEAVPRETQVAAFAALAAAPEWVLDDDGPGGMMFAEADLLILLDYPRWVSLRRLLGRSIHRAISQTPVCNGNYESWARLCSRDSQLRWHARSWKRKRRVMRDLAADNRERALLFRTPVELRAWMRSLAAAT